MAQKRSERQSPSINSPSEAGESNGPCSWWGHTNWNFKFNFEAGRTLITNLFGIPDNLTSDKTDRKMEIVKIPLIIERGDDKLLWGRVEYKGNLITDFGDSIPELEEKMKVLLWEFEEVYPEMVQFEYQFDIYALFQRFDFLKISNVAEHAGMNPGLLRQYVSGAKNPSEEQAKKIERTLHKLAQELQKVTIVAS
jgi:hypothetical protein